MGIFRKNRENSASNSNKYKNVFQMEEGDDYVYFFTDLHSKPLWEEISIDGKAFINPRGERGKKKEIALEEILESGVFREDGTRMKELDSERINAIYFPEAIYYKKGADGFSRFDAELGLKKLKRTNKI